jgi:hypothetical protein
MIHLYFFDKVLPIVFIEIFYENPFDKADIYAFAAVICYFATASNRDRHFYNVLAAQYFSQPE